MIKRIDRNFFIPKYYNNIRVLIDIPVRDEHAVDIPKRTEEDFLEKMAKGYYSYISQCIKAYEKSPLPERFLKKQAFIVTNYLPSIILGQYKEDGDIYLEPDALSGIRYISKEFLFAHVLGYKIQQFRNVEPCYDIIRRVYDTSNENFQKKVLSDIFGSIVSGRNEAKEPPMEKEVHEQLKLEALKSVYRV